MQLKKKQHRFSESWSDFHQVYHSDEYENSANNPSILRKLGHVPSTFCSSKNDRSFVDQLFLTRQDSATSLGDSSSSNLSGSDRRGRISGSSRTRGSLRKGESLGSVVGSRMRRGSQVNILKKLGQKSGGTGGKRWSVSGLLSGGRC